MQNYNQLCNYGGATDSDGVRAAIEAEAQCVLAGGWTWDPQTCPSQSPAASPTASAAGSASAAPSATSTHSPRDICTLCYCQGAPIYYIDCSGRGLTQVFVSDFAGMASLTSLSLVCLSTQSHQLCCLVPVASRGRPANLFNNFLFQLLFHRPATTSVHSRRKFSMDLLCYSPSSW